MLISLKAALPFETNGYLQVFLEGGLNQLRMGVSVPVYKLSWFKNCYDFVSRYAFESIKIHPVVFNSLYFNLADL